MIRTVQPQDAAAMAEIFAPVVAQTAISFSTEAPTAAGFQKKIVEITATLPWFVFEQGGTVKGYAYASPHRSLGAYRWCVEVSIYVAADAHRNGIASALYEKLLTTLRALGYYNAYAGITVPNEASIRFHEAFGFERFCVFQQIGHKLGMWHDVAWYRLALQPEYASPPAEPNRFGELAEG